MELIAIQIPMMYVEAAFGKVRPLPLFQQTGVLWASADKRGSSSPQCSFSGPIPRREWVIWPLLLHPLFGPFSLTEDLWAWWFRWSLRLHRFESLEGCLAASIFLYSSVKKSEERLPFHIMEFVAIKFRALSSSDNTLIFVWTLEKIIVISPTGIRRLWYTSIHIGKERTKLPPNTFANLVLRTYIVKKTVFM